MAVDFVSADATKSVLTWPELIAAMRQAYSVPHGPQTSFRAVARGDGAWLRGLVSVPPDGAFMGVKSFGRTPSRQVCYLVSLFCKDSSALIALVDGKHLTTMRTAATSAMAVDTLSRPGPVAVGLLGSGAEARAHAEAVAAVRPVSDLSIFSPNPAKRRALADTLSDALGVPVQAVDTAEAAVRDKGLVIAAARSYDEQPILRGDWLAPEALLVSIGSTIPEQRELDLGSIERSDLIVCDMIDEVRHETGDFIAAQKAGLNTEDKLVTLNQIMLGQLDDRLLGAKRRMYKSVGAALQDVTAAALAHRLALKAGRVAAFPIDLEIQHV